jgi:DNA-binding NarL/FixJ family response regulator
VESQSAPSVWVDDSHSIVRRGIVWSLTAEGCTVVGESVGLEPAPELDGVDVLLFEARRGALGRAKRLVEGRDTRLVATVRGGDERQMRELVEAEVGAVLPQADLTPESLGASVRAVVAGGVTLPPDLLPRLLKLIPAQPGGGGLSSRERDVLRLLADGHDTREIATDLCYSERTVKNVVHDVLMKLNCRTRAHAVALATREGVI